MPSKDKRVLFIYGKDKRTYFHGNADLAVLEQSEHGDYLGVKGGHWFYDARVATSTVAAVDEVVGKILSFLEGGDRL